MARTTKEIQPEVPPQRRGWVKPLSADAGITGAAAFARAGFRDPALVLRWREIAGDAVARIAQPLKLADDPQGIKGGGGTLTLRAAPAAALFLGHEKRALCERINAYLGREAVTQIKFSQGAPLVRPPPPRPNKPAGPMPAADPSLRYHGPDGLAEALQALARRR